MIYRPAKAFVNLPALKFNLGLAKQLAPHSKVLAVIKANGYGHGINRVAQHLNDADGFGVASIDEAMILRHKGFLHRILLLEGLFSALEMPLVVQNRLDLVIHSQHQLDWLLNYPNEASINVWIKIDTGMHRLGFSPERVPRIIRSLSEHANAYQIHLISHFASADEFDEASNAFTQQQIKCFNEICQAYDFPRSIVNSAGLQRFSEVHYDWVRPGILLYGAGLVGEHKLPLKTVMSLVSEVIALRWVKAGDAVGYGNTWIAPRDTFVGVVAIGYGDGYPRHAPNGTPVLIRGHRMPLIGRVSMDMITVDLTNIATEVLLGDVVTLWGEQLSVDEVAQYAGTIGYELLCGITQRVPMIEIQ